MKTRLKRLVATEILTATLIVSLLPLQVRADPTKEFIMACTYGVLAGTLVGAATLAFTNKPGDNLNNIARGASLGLYSGMALGAYVIWVVPGQGQGGEEGTDPTLSPGEGPLPEEGAEGEGGEARHYRGPIIIPIATERGQLDGALVSFNLLKF